MNISSLRKCKSLQFSWQLNLNFWQPPASLENFLLALFYVATISFPIQFVPYLFTSIAKFRSTKLAYAIISV